MGDIKSPIGDKYPIAEWVFLSQDNSATEKNLEVNQNVMCKPELKQILKSDNGTVYQM